MLASSKHPKEAQAFLKWVTGKGGQDVLKTGNSFEYAVGKGAESNPALVPLADLQAPKVEPSTLDSQEGDRPDDGSRLALVRVRPETATDCAPAEFAFRRSALFFEVAFVHDDKLHSWPCLRPFDRFRHRAATARRLS